MIKRYVLIHDEKTDKPIDLREVREIETNEELQSVKDYCSQNKAEYIARLEEERKQQEQLLLERENRIAELEKSLNWCKKQINLLLGEDDDGTN
jgi:hypothetical protein